MLRNEKLSLPDNWEAALELTMLQQPARFDLSRTYICSPCRADTPEGVIRNMKAARIYMLYAFSNFPGVPRAPHAYLPVILNDRFDHERNIALHFGERLLMDCDLMLVCGDRLSDGMYGEIVRAVELDIPVKVFSKWVYDVLCTRLSLAGIDTENLNYNAGHPHMILSWGSDELAPYWEDHDDM